MVVTVAERKARDIARLRLAASQAMSDLSAYAVRHHGQFAIFGSFARGEIRYDSDLDVLVSFTAADERAARDVAEQICRRHGLTPDVHLASEASDALLARVRRDAVTLP